MRSPLLSLERGVGAPRVVVGAAAQMASEIGRRQHMLGKKSNPLDLPEMIDIVARRS